MVFRLLEDKRFELSHTYTEYTEDGPLSLVSVLFTLMDEITLQCVLCSHSHFLLKYLSGTLYLACTHALCLHWSPWTEWVLTTGWIGLVCRGPCISIVRPNLVLLVITGLIHLVSSCTYVRMYIVPSVYAKWLCLCDTELILLYSQALSAGRSLCLPWSAHVCPSRPICVTCCLPNSLETCSVWGGLVHALAHVTWFLNLHWYCAQTPWLIHVVTKVVTEGICIVTRT